MKILKKTLIILSILIILSLSINFISAEDIVNETSNDNNMSVGTYTDLYNNISATTDENPVLELNESYRFDSDVDNESFVDGVTISKSITLVGKEDTYIDGNFLASGLNIASNCNVILKNLTFKNGYSETVAGSILVGKNSTLLIENCVFDSNTAHNSNGGAIYGLDGTDIEIHNSLFINNTADRVSDLPWSKFKKGMGSAICMRIGSNLKLFDSIFKNHVAYVTTILIITWDDVNTEQSTLYVENCLFENNTAYSNGAIYLDEFGIAEIKNSIFRKNKSTDMGGTIVFDATKYATVTNCTFEDNDAIEGGGIYINTFDPKYDSHVEISDSTFNRNSVTKAGGGIFSIRGVTKVTNCNFNDNKAKMSGGGVYSNFNSIRITDCSFKRNTAEYGGGALLKSEVNIVSGCTFERNAASLNGGAIYSNAGKIQISNSRFTSNSGKSGGALFFKSEKQTVSSSTFERNTASENGGAVYAKNGTVHISGSSFTSNSAQNGGAAYLKAENNVVSTSTFQMNSASEIGGAIYSNNNLIKISGSKFNSNSAKNGGALYLKSDKNTVTTSSFVRNIASQTGGAIYSKMDAVSSSKCSYSKNIAKKASKVYGVYYAKVTKYVTAAGNVKIKVVITSPWKMSVSKKKIKIKTNKYSSKWVKTNSKGVYTFTIPKKVKATKKTLTIKIDEGFSVIKKFTDKDPGKITLSKKVKKSSKLEVTVKNSKSKNPISKTKFKVKIFTGKKYKKITVKTDSKGVFKIKMKKFSLGKHDISIYLSNKNYYINKKMSFEIK
jgi:predicted outer membrane repeat protein